MKFNEEKYKVYTWKNWMMLHWIINPGLAINELILGQRTPKIYLEDITTDKPSFERSFVPCPHCETIHDARVWSSKNGTAFQNWFGLYCPSCGNTIPCLTNVLSFAILAITFPIWGWFRKSLKAKWLEKQPERYQHIILEYGQESLDNKFWLKQGLKWGAIMFLIMSIGFPYLIGNEITWRGLGVGIIIWIIAGLLAGYALKLISTGKLHSRKERAARMG